VSALTRRAALGGAGATLLAAAVPASAAVDDASILGDLAPIEQALAFTYGAAVNSGSARVRDIATRFAPHEAGHVIAVNQALEAMGAAKAPIPRSAEEVDRVAARLGVDPGFSELRSADEILGFALSMEEALAERWIAAHRKLADQRLLQMATGILGCQAQHLVVLRRALGRDPLPAAFEAAS
jgi:hypothetical protein